MLLLAGFAGTGISTPAQAAQDLPPINVVGSPIGCPGGGIPITTNGSQIGCMGPGGFGGPGGPGGSSGGGTHGGGGGSGFVPIPYHPGITVSPDGKNVYDSNDDLGCGSEEEVLQILASRVLVVNPYLPAGSTVTIHMRNGSGSWETQKFTYAHGSMGALGFVPAGTCG